MIIDKTNISISKVKTILGTNVSDLGLLCISDNINKWSKHKPIRFDKTTGLLENDFRGEAGDISLGIIFGLKAEVDPMHIDKLHEANYTYIGKPSGGEHSPYRLGDFSGYDSNAVCNTNCIIHDFDFNIGKSSNLNITLNYDENNTTGIDLNEFVHFTIEGGIGIYYPVILVGDYLRAMINSKTDTYTPFKVDGIWLNQFKVQIDSTFPYKNEGNYIFSIGLIEKILLPGGIDFSKEWIEVKNKGFNTGNVIAVPDCTGLTLKLIKPKVKFDVVYKELRDLSLSGFSCVTNCNTELEKAYNCTINLTFKNSSDHSVSSYSYDIIKQANRLIVAENVKKINWSDFGIRPIGSLNGELTIRIKNNDTGDVSDPVIENITIK